MKTNEQDKRPVTHYVMLEPGEKIIVLTDKVAGDGDHHTYVFEVTIPTEEHDGELYHTPTNGHMTDTHLRGKIEMNGIANLTSEYAEPVPVLTAFALHHSKQHERRPFMAVPLDENMITPRTTADPDEALLETFGVGRPEEL